MSLMSRKSPILSSLSARRKHHIHTPPAEKANTNGNGAEKREQPFGELKSQTDPNAPKSYKSIFSL